VQIGASVETIDEAPRNRASRHQGDESMPASERTVPRFIRRRVPRFGWRHVKGVAAVRAVAALWLLALGAIFCAYGYWWGALLFVAAVLDGWLAWQMPRWKRVLDAGNGSPERLTKRDTTT
jgi:hypothetical protein